MRTMERLPVACLCLLLSCSAVGSAGSRVEVDEGSDAILPCSLNTKEDIRSEVFDWKKDPQGKDLKKDVFLYEAGIISQHEQFKGRTIYFPDELQHGNASIIIRKTKLADSGKYTCDFPHLLTPQTSHIELVVGSRVVVFEDSDVILPCSLNTKEDITSRLFDWMKDPLGKDSKKDVFLYDAGLYYDKGRTGQDEQFRGRVSHFPDELQHGNASIIIRKTKLADSGEYTCDFPRLQPPQTFHIELVVGAAPEPSVTILHETKHQVLLQCEVKGASPKPEVEWRDSSGNILHAEEPLVSERGGSFNIILTTTVNKTDRYRCVSTQKEIYHQIEAEIHVVISGAAAKPSVKILHQTNHQALLQCEVKGASPKPEVEWKDSSGNILHAEEPLVSESGGSFNIVVNITVTKTDTYHCVATQKEINLQTEADTYVYISGSTGFIVAVLLGILLVVAVVLQAVLYRKGCITLNFNRGSTSTSQQPPDGDEVQEKLSGPHLFQAA